jgi:predicted metallopeptidase
MGISYELAPDLQEKVNEIASMLFPHVKLDSVVCIRSFGSGSRGTIARCHALGKAMQLALGRRGFYVIEVISKRFDNMSEVDKIKTLIHELMHIPKSFGGGFIHHNIVHERNVEKEFQRYVYLKKINLVNEANDINRVPINFDNDFDKIIYNKVENDDIDKKLTPGQRVEREFFVVLDKPEKEFIVKKKKRFWF